MSEFHIEQTDSLDSSARNSAGNSAVQSKNTVTFTPPTRFTALFIDDIHLEQVDIGRVGKALTHYLDGVNFTEERIGCSPVQGRGRSIFLPTARRCVRP